MSVGHVIATTNPPRNQTNPNPVGTGGHRPGDTAKITFSILNSADTFTALADLNTGRPAITGGGAKWNTVDRPLRTGLSVFAGYDPVQLTIPLLFDNFIQGDTIEDDVDLLWRMWGRGVKAANASANKAAPVIVVDGDLLPKMVRYGSSNQDPPNWVITDITEDATSAVHNSASHLVRLAVTVTLTQYVTSSALAALTGTPDPSTSTRTKTNTYPAGSTMRKIATKQRSTVAELRALNNYGSNHSLDAYLRDPNKKFAKSLAVKVPRVAA